MRTKIEAVMVKLYASEIQEEVCSDGIQLHGCFGHLQEHPA
jgi:alkylation response protein AidB-like acyl-CoA dehydrogenase